MILGSSFNARFHSTQNIYHCFNQYIIKNKKENLFFLKSLGKERNYSVKSLQNSKLINDYD